MAKRVPIGLSDVGEFGLIRIINRFLSKGKDRALVVGIGDDAAVIKVGRSEWMAVTTDALVESVHFDFASTDSFSLGWKALAVNVSDVVAMGGVPRWALISLVVREGVTLRSIREFYRGLRTCARYYGVTVIGGNVARSRREFSATLTLLGDVKPSHLLRRSGAKPGQIVAVTGRPGLSAAGMSVLVGRLSKSVFPNAVRSHLRPRPRLQTLQRLLSAGVVPGACIDTSDGIASDLAHVCDESRTGARLNLDQVPLHPEVVRIGAKTGQDPLKLALSGGEDYELLMTFSEQDFGSAKRLLKGNLTAIGVVTGAGPILGMRKTGRPLIIQRTGFSHF